MSELIKITDEDSGRIISEMKADLEFRLNRQIAPADVEMLIIQGLAYRETIIRSQINDAYRQSLVAFARGASLEYLGELVGVYRLPAAPAYVVLTFTLVDGQTGITIPEGLRVQSTDGKAIFQTIETVIVPAGVIYVNIKAACSEAGTIGNNYSAGTIIIILDPKPYLVGAQNLDQSSGGSDEESDDDLRERIKLAPASFSVAGPSEAYKFFAKSASPSIADVAITNPTPGEVHIFPLLSGGVIPGQALLDTVYAICNGEKVRPLTDTVIVSAPTKIDYAIEVELTILSNAVNLGADSTVLDAIQRWVDSKKNILGVDVVRNKIAALSMLDGIVYNVDVISPETDIVANPEDYTNCTGITVTINGTHDQ
ncbi:baseplate assembly protein [Arachidicoccus terrestris]|uniref:baseplate assembly protein n=1 Tax=Arachidicoccus terrestris TaxID=2875539 RepID=UPI001CC7ED90|nr:baseplate J/gp47 family protein [Arachidicoccus terrestris]UAY56272.1 baseplate J/gp47 family protein [Arachidicoccus terrestris]